MKKILVVLFSIILLTGCQSGKKVISSADFREIMNDNNYQLNDVNKYYDYANSALEYIDPSSNFSVFYLSGDNNITIKGVYADECKNIQAKNDKEIIPIINKGDNYSTFEFETEDTYYYLAWVEGTLLKTECSIKNKKVMQELVEKIGY